jgi:hypothetical protein
MSRGEINEVRCSVDIRDCGIAVAAHSSRDFASFWAFIFGAFTVGEIEKVYD